MIATCLPQGTPVVIIFSHKTKNRPKPFFQGAPTVMAGAPNSRRIDEETKKSLDSLINEIDHLEQLAKNYGSMDAVERRATKALTAQQQLAMNLNAQQQVAAERKGSGVERPTPPAGGPPPPRRRPQPAAQPPAALNTPVTPDKRVEVLLEEELITEALQKEGYDLDLALAAAKATKATTVKAARDWLIANGRAPSRKARDEHGSLGSSGVRAIRTLQQQQSQQNAKVQIDRGVAESVPAHTLAAQATRDGPPHKAPLPLHSLSPRVVSESHALPPPPWLQESPVKFGVGIPTNTQPSPQANVSIQVRGPDGVSKAVGKLFLPTATIRSVIHEYLRLFPIHPHPKPAELVVVVPWLRAHYTYEAMGVTSLEKASLCPSATIVLQLKKL